MFKKTLESFAMIELKIIPDYGEAKKGNSFGSQCKLLCLP